MNLETIMKKIRDAMAGDQKAIFTFLIIAWIPWAILCFPGNLPYDSGTAISWFMNIDRSNVNNPWFQNLLMGLFYRAGDLINLPDLGIYLYCWIQMLLEAWVLSRIIAFLTEKIHFKKAACILVPFYAFLPVFPIYAFSMGKDSNFAIAMLFTIDLLIRATNKSQEFWAKASNCWTLAMMPSVLGLLRNNAGWIPLGMIFFLIIKTKKLTGLLPAVSSLLAFVISTIFLPGVIGIPDGEIKEIMSIPLQCTAHYISVHTDEVTDEEWSTIDKVIDRQVLLDYDPMIADPIKNESSFSLETRTEFLNMWWNMFKKHPGTILQGWWRSIDRYFSLTEISPIKKHFSISVNIVPELKEKLHLHYWKIGNYLAREISRISVMIPVIRVVQKIGLYSWLSLIMILVSIIFRKLWKFIPCCGLLIMVLIACIFSPVNGYYRYAYSMILSVPVVLIAMLGFCSNECLFHKGKSTMQ